MWRVLALVVQLFLLASVLTTYFNSTILSGLLPQKTMREMGLEPPADRLVVFLTDGLPAASFLGNNGIAVPELRDLYRTQGRLAIYRSHAASPIANGHIAIFGGFEQDPIAAALLNFRYISIHFDTVFNRSRTAIGWVDKNVEKVFKNLKNGGAPLRFSVGLGNKLEFDDWAFSQVKEFLAKGDNVREVLSLQSVVFFVYLGGMAKPLSPEFDQKLHRIQKGVRSTYELFEEVFKNGRTAYLLTSNPVRRNSGYNGTASSHEIETPLFMWGSGVNRTVGREAVFPSKENLSAVEQIQLAPLMSAMIGLAPPMNNLAMVPLGYLNADYEVMALYLNALQILDQAEIIISRYRQARFYKWLPRFQKLDQQQISSYKVNFKSLVSQQNRQDAMEASQKIIELAQSCLKYYHGYYKTAMMVSTTISYLAWFYCLLLQLTRLASGCQRKGFATVSTVLLTGLGIIEIVMLYLQKVSFLTSVCLLLPICLLVLAQAERPAKGPLILAPLLNVVCTLVPAALAILMSFRYKHLAVLYALSVFLNNRRLCKKPPVKFFLWMVLVWILSASLFIAQNPKYTIDPKFLKSSYVLFFGMLVALARPLVLRYQLDPRVWAINAISLVAGAYGIYKLDSNKAVPEYVSAICWFFLVYAFLSVRYRDADTPKAKRRLEMITMNMVTLHALLCERWDSLAIQILGAEVVLGLQLYKDSRRSVLKNPEPVLNRRPLEHLKQSYTFGFAIVLYFYVSLELAGNGMAANTARLFYPNYAFFITGSLIIMKIVLPSLIVISSLYAMVPFVRLNTRSTFTCFLLISNVMGVYFHCFVGKKDQYQLIITHVVNMLLLGCSCIAECFLCETEMERPPRRDKRRVRFSLPVGESQI